MRNGDRTPEAPFETRNRLRGERYLGHEDKSAASFLQACANGAKIHLGLARPGHTVDESHFSTAAVEAFRHKREGLRLPLREFERFKARALRDIFLVRKRSEISGILLAPARRLLSSHESPFF